MGLFTRSVGCFHAWRCVRARACGWVSWVSRAGANRRARARGRQAQVSGVLAVASRQDGVHGWRHAADTSACACFCMYFPRRVGVQSVVGGVGALGGMGGGQHTAAEVVRYMRVRVSRECGHLVTCASTDDRTVTRQGWWRLVRGRRSVWPCCWNRRATIARLVTGFAWLLCWRATIEQLVTWFASMPCGVIVMGVRPCAPTNTQRLVSCDATGACL